MTKLRALILAVVLAAGATLLGPAPPASADTDISPYADCAGALAVGSGNTGRMVCVDRVTAYGPIFQVFSNWSLYYAASVHVDPRSNVYNNHRWTGAEWVPSSGSTPATGFTHAHDPYRRFHTAPISNMACQFQWQCAMIAESNDPGVRAWFYHAAADPTLNVVWIDR